MKSLLKSCITLNKEKEQSSTLIDIKTRSNTNDNYIAKGQLTHGFQKFSMLKSKKDIGILSI